MNMWLIWIIVCAILVVVEVLTQMIWTICLAIGCLAAMIATFFDLSVPYQIVVMAVAAVVAYIFLMPVFKKWHAKVDIKEGRNASTGMDALLGRRAVVTNEIRPGELGRARIDGDSWQVKAPNVKNVIRHGQEVVVTGYDSIILTVAELPEADTDK